MSNPDTTPLRCRPELVQKLEGTQDHAILETKKGHAEVAEGNGRTLLALIKSI